MSGDPAIAVRRGPAVERPVMRYHGGKWKIADWIIGFFPPHEIYVEPFGGAASVLLRKVPALRYDVYNDMDHTIVDLFRVLRDPEQSEQLRRLCYLTPWARAEFEATYRKPSRDPVENARRTLFRAAGGFGATAFVRNKTGFRSSDSSNGGHALYAWEGWPAEVPAICERLRNVVIENWPAEKIIRSHDGPTTLFYLDPPYVMSTRNPRSERKVRNGRNGEGDYLHEMTDEHHRELAALVHSLEGMVVLSGYPCELYDRELYADLVRFERAHVANGGRPRREVVWLNKRCADALHVLGVHGAGLPSLFDD